MKRSVLVFVLWIAIAGLSGCVDARRSDTWRTGVEQLVLSTAVDRAASKFDFSTLEGKRVHVDASNLEAVDRGYILSWVRKQLLESGAMLVDNTEEDGPADVIVEPYSGSLGTDGSDSLIGLPSISLSVMGTGFSTPEVAFFKSSTQRAEAKLLAHGRWASDGELAFSTEPRSASAYYNRYVVLFVPFSLTDVPEKKWAWPWARWRRDE